METHQESWGTGTSNLTETHQYKELKIPTSFSISPSPSHEFSFGSINTVLSTSHADFSPADDIFFYGHMLPLRLFPHLPSPSDSFTIHGTKPMQNKSPLSEPTRPLNPKSFTFFKKWKKGSEDETKKKMTQRKFRKELSRLLKKYVTFVKPLLMFNEGRRNKSNDYKPRPICYSGNLSFGAKKEVRRRGGEYSSAPTSIRTSPANSGILLTAANRLPSPVSDSTMEELHSAIQAAIAHCKNSLAADSHCKI